MKRHAFALQIKQNQADSFRRSLGLLWPDITFLLDAYDCCNFSLWSIEDLVFGYYESPEEILSGPAGRSDCGLSDRYRKILNVCEPLVRWISAPHEAMRLMYQDYGIVRKKKELIRHRVFATLLKGDFQKEYKRRHDALSASRKGTVNPGLDSNFTIWNAGRYVFGYDEIDTTMEKAVTAASREADVQWETKMLEIMDWYTDDVDWFTGQHHSHIIRLASYKPFSKETGNG